MNPTREEQRPQSVTGGEFRPVVDAWGHEVWLTADGYIEWVSRADGDEPGDGWVRLYRPAGGAA